MRDIFRSIAKIRSAVAETRDSSRSFLARHVVRAAHRNRARRERAAGADEETPRARLRDSVTTFDVFRFSSRGEGRPASVCLGFDPIRRESTRPRRPFLGRQGRVEEPGDIRTDGSLHEEIKVSRVAGEVTGGTE